METIKKMYQVRGSGFGVVVSLPETDEEKQAGYGSVSFDTQVWGQAPTWDDIHAALYWGEDYKNLGEMLETTASIAHDARTAPWRVEKHTGMSGRVDYLVRVRDEIAEKYGTAGKITASLHISCAGKLNRGIPTMGLADWYVLLKTVPSLSWKEAEEAYKNYPPKELRTVSAEWHAPGAEPWDGDKTAPDEEGPQGKGYTLEGIHERVRETADETPEPLKKYEILREPEHAHPNNPMAYRIRALRDIPRYGVKAGDLGGYVESEENLDQKGLCWVRDDALVCDGARVWGDALVYGNALVCDYAQVWSNAQVGGYAQVRDRTKVFNNARVWGNAQVYDCAQVWCDAQIYGNAQVYGYAQACNDARVYDNARVYDSAVCGIAHVRDDAQVYGYAKIGGGTEVWGDAQIYGDTQVYGDARFGAGAEVQQEQDVLVMGLGGPYATFCRTNTGISVFCDDFSGTLEEFRERETHDDMNFREHELLCQLAEMHILGQK